MAFGIEIYLKVMDQISAMISAIFEGSFPLGITGIIFLRAWRLSRLTSFELWALSETTRSLAEDIP